MKRKIKQRYKYLRYNMAGEIWRMTTMVDFTTSSLMASDIF